MPTPQHHAEFKLSITKALADQLAAALAKLVPVPLTPEAIQDLPVGPGVYQLYMNGERLYVGKASKSLPTRLRKHYRKLSGRPIPAKISFACLYLDEDLEASAPEKMLLGKYEGKYERSEGTRYQNIPWNNNGFGNNDPGRNRDHSEIPENHFDATYSIKLDLLVELDSGSASVGHVLTALKKGLPYNLRFQDPRRSTKAREDYGVPIEPSGEPIAVRSALKLVIRTLPEGWQATALPGYVILYFERKDYDSALYWWRRDGDDVVETPGPRLLAPAADIVEDSGNGEDEE